MADVGVRLVVIGLSEFRRDITSAQGDIRGLESEIRNLSGTSSQIGQQLTTLGNTIAGVGRSMTLFITTPIIGMGTALEAMGIKFEDGFAGITKTVGGLATGFDEIQAAAKEKLGITVTTMDEARDAAAKLGMKFGDLTPMGEEVKQQFRDLAKTIPLATDQLLHLGELVGALGVNKDEIAAVTKNVAELGITTDVSAEDAAVGLIKFGNIIHGTSLDVADFTHRAGSALVDLGNKSVSTEGEILDVTLRLAAAGQKAKLTEPEILAWGTTLSDLGIQAELGGSALSRVFNAMTLSVANGGDELKLFAQITGKTTEQFQHDFRENASSAMLDFVQKFYAAIQAGKITEDMLKGTSLAGIRVIDVFGRMGNASSLFTKNLAIANEGWSQNVALEDEAEKKINTTASQIQILKNTIQDLGVTLFDLTKDKIAGAIKMIQDLIATLQKLTPEQQKMIITVLLIAAAIGPVLVVLGGFIAALGVIITAVTSLLTPIGLLVALVLAMGLAFATAIPVLIQSQQAKQIFADLKDIFTQVVGFVTTALVPSFERLQATVSGNLMNALDKFANWFHEHKEEIVQTLDTIATIGAGAFNALANIIFTFVVPAFNTIVGILGTFWSIVMQLSDFIGTKFNVNLGGAADIIKNLVLGALTSFSKWFAENKEPIVGTLETILTVAQTVFGSIKQTVVDDVLPQLKVAFETISKTFGDTGITWQTVAQVISAVIIALGALIVGVLTGIAPVLQAWAMGWQYIIDGVKNIILGFQTWFKGVTDVVMGILTLDFPRVLQGFKEEWDGVWTAVEGIAQVVAGLVIQILGGLLGFIGGFITGVIDFFTNLSDTLVGHSIIPDMVNSMIQWWNKLTDPFQRVFNTITNAMNAFKEKVNGLVTTVKNSVDKMIDDMHRLLSSITSSPTLTVQHPFEAFEEYLKATEFKFNLNMGNASSAASKLNTVHQSTISNSNTSIDRSIRFGDISGVPMSNEVDLADLLTQRMQAVGGRP